MFLFSQVVEFSKGSGLKKESESTMGDSVQTQLRIHTFHRLKKEANQSVRVRNQSTKTTNRILLKQVSTRILPNKCWISRTRFKRESGDQERADFAVSFKKFCYFN